jgi:probable H4MPT-linked C1 transfer pathway protein
MTQAVLGLDVGGANLKAAHTNGAARSRPFALWKDPAGLAAALRVLIAEMPPADGLAVTMTGELCDCFETKRQGVASILAAVEDAAAGKPVGVWTIDGHFVDLPAAREAPLKAAAANWLALATFAGGFAPVGPAVLLDVGSTTTDIVPVLNGRPIPQGYTDRQRLAYGELVYTGVRRTPVCAVLDRFGTCGGIAAELFATTLDAYVMLGMILGDPADHSTADGRPATVANAHARMARMLCADVESSTEYERLRLAEAVMHAQLSKIDWGVATAIRELPSRPKVAMLTGEGAFLAEAVLARVDWFRSCQVRHILEPEAACAACACAVAVLAAELPETAPHDAILRRR